LGPRKKLVEGKQFATDADVKQAVTSWLQTPDTHFFYAGIRVTMGKLLGGNCTSSVTHIPQVDGIQN